MVKGVEEAGSRNRGMEKVKMKRTRSKDGTVLASESPAGGMSLPKEWWKDSKVLDNPSVTRRTGLVDRSKTPFALINPDDYEVVQ